MGWVENCFPLDLADDPISMQSSEIIHLRNKFAAILSESKIPNPQVVANRALALVVVQGKAMGIFAPMGANGTPLLSALIDHLTIENPSINNSNADQVDGIHKAISLLSYLYHPTDFCIPPACFDDSPLAFWLFQYAQTCLYPRCLGFMHRMVLEKIRTGFSSRNPKFNSVTVTRSYTYVLLIYARKIQPVKVANLSDLASCEDLAELLMYELARVPPPDRNKTGEAYSNYSSCIRSILGQTYMLDWDERYSVPKPKRKKKKKLPKRRSFEQTHEAVLSPDDYEDKSNKSKWRREFVNSSTENDRDILDFYKDFSDEEIRPRKCAFR